MVMMLVLLTLFVGLGRFAFGVAPVQLSDPFVWYKVVAHFWIGALFWIGASRRYTAEERRLAWGCLGVLTALEIGYFVLMKGRG